ncbi:selenocysteine-specific translation elongation factor [Massilia dura]|uniref:Selenocysteine-specific translation elongation factor n=1 Tax=Pseudoduganella dura TaxID=321982 RepID=A0A6I3XEB0_9BURK|nr:selenocysteine-specific translation elongation factor [Pseudoduganella dura]MUI11088.1 selenocysteine-specific translation elongation factor [Pseudoduganella dura]GGY03346.1 selenocysteine-specific translation factor [Pseudoduganella dura]
MIVGTAGHIDHGKTTLTRALTGVDTDRLKEEKARGISIELGYAYLPLAGGDILGVIDVPGHEKFIRTMASGVTGIDCALLVIAADDGIMPQTVEHLAILQLLGVRRGAVALTKTDRADAQRIAAVERDIAALLAGTPFSGAPMFRTAATQPGDPGVAALLRHLSDVARALPSRDDRRLFRLGVDRVFTLSGQGTVVTGTALSGRVAVGDVLALAPGGGQARVRGMHAQSRSATEGHGGQRLALNLAGVAKEDIERGTWIVAPALAACSERLDARLTLAGGAKSGVLKAWSPVHVHLGASHHTAHIVPLDADTVQPGLPARAQLVFDVPVHAMPGDRFVVRNAQATHTIGGGIVLDPFGAARKRRSPARLAWLDALQAYVDSGDVSALLAQSPQGARAATLVRLTQLPVDAMPLPPGCLRLPLSGGDELWIAEAALAGLERSVLEALAGFHAKQPDDAGPELWRLKRMAQPDAEDALWSALAARMLAAGTIAQRGHSLHLPGHSVALTQEEEALAAPLLAAIGQGRFDPPWVRDLAKDCRVPEDEVRRLLRKLARAGQLSQVVPDLFYHPRALAEMARIVATLPDTQAASFRDATNLGRKRAIQVLEYFDRVGYTRRVRNSHLVRPNAHWPDPG